MTGSFTLLGAGLGRLALALEQRRSPSLAMRRWAASYAAGLPDLNLSISSVRMRAVSLRRRLLNERA